MKKIGVIGLGIMGAAMARNIQQEAAFDLMVWNRGRERLETFLAAGTKVASSPKDMAVACDAILIMVTGPKALIEVINGPEGVAHADLSGKVVINVSTVSREATRFAAERVAQAGGAFLDAPVSGSKIPAEQGELIFLVGGEEGTIARCDKLFDILGKQTVHCGEAGAGTRMKLAINLMLANMMHALSEGLVFCQTLGLSPERFLEALHGGVLNAPMFQMKGKAILREAFEAQFPLEHAFKDLDLVLDEAARDGIDLPVTGTVWESFNDAMEKGLGKEDFSAVFKALKG